jgi:hypothetical protein
MTFEVVYVGGIALGVGIKRDGDGAPPYPWTLHEMICNTILPRKKLARKEERKYARDAEKWAKRICDALNKQEADRAANLRGAK